MKLIGIKNMSKDALDEIFDKEHKGTSVKDIVGAKLTVVGFAVYDDEGTYKLKFLADSGQGKTEDFYTSSQVFIKDFMRLAKLHDEDENMKYEITVCEGESQKGRKYLYIEEAPKKESKASAWRNIEWQYDEFGDRRKKPIPLLLGGRYMLEIRVLMTSGAEAIFHSDIPMNALNWSAMQGYVDEYAKRLNDKVYDAIIIDMNTGYTFALQEVKMKKSKINISKQRKKQLLETRLVETEKGTYERYKVTPSQITDKDISYMVNVINKRLYNIEKLGYSEESQEYQVIKKYATGEKNKGKDKIFYNVSNDDTTIRVKTSARGLTGRDRERYINILRGIMNAKTSTVKGTKGTIDQRYNTFLANRNLTSAQLPKEKYYEMWRIYRKQIAKDKRDKFDSSKMVSLIELGDFYNLTTEQMNDALKYVAQQNNDVDDYYEWALQNKKQSNKRRKK